MECDEICGILLGMCERGEFLRVGKKRLKFEDTTVDLKIEECGLSLELCSWTLVQPKILRFETLNEKPQKFPPNQP